MKKFSNPNKSPSKHTLYIEHDKKFKQDYKLMNT